MRTRRILLLICRLITAFGSFVVSFYGLYALEGMGIQKDSLATWLFCILPLLSFPVFVFSYFRFPLAVWLHWLLAMAYMADFAVLDWRTCSEHGYCYSAVATVLSTLRIRPVQAAFAVAIFHLAAIRLCIAQGRARAKARAAEDVSPKA
jgi:hypothetical protein